MKRGIPIVAQQSENNGNFPGFMGIFNNVMQNLSKENNQKMNEILNLIYKKIYELKG